MSTANDLHREIMNLPCNVSPDAETAIGGGFLYKLGHRDARHAAAELVLSRLAAPASEVRVKPLRWWERIQGEEWTASHGDNVYTVRRQDDQTFRVSIPERGGLMVGRTMVLGIFATAEEGRDCAQADHDGRILSCIEVAA